MPNLAAHAALAVDDGFRRRLQAALVQKATFDANKNQPTDQTKVAAWTARKALAALVLSDPVAFVTRYAWPVAGAQAVLDALAAANSDVTAVSDTVIETALDKALDSLIAAQTQPAVPAP